MIVRQDLLDEDDMRTSSMPKMLAGEIRKSLSNFTVICVVCVCVRACVCVCVHV